MSRLKVLLCASGGLGAKTLKNALEMWDISAVMTNGESEEIIYCCNEFKIPCFIGNPRKGKAHRFLVEQGIVCEYLLSVNYLYLIEKDLIDFPQKAALNIHGSLLPKYRGRTPHVWSIINGEKEVGITVHLISEGCDEGDIVIQQKIPLTDDETGGGILKKYEALYFPLIESAVELLENGHSPRKQDHSLATYYGKRTPDDGEILWSWETQRIYNWVRAQTTPYPGAFSWLNGEKVVILKCKVVSKSCDQAIVNGTVIENSASSFVVKVNDGSIEVTDYSFSKMIQCGMTLGIK